MNDECEQMRQALRRLVELTADLHDEWGDEGYGNGVTWQSDELEAAIANAKRFL